MISPFRNDELNPRDLANYGFAHVKDIAFDAVKELWRRRRSEGMRQIDLAQALKRDPAWISRALSAPGNWTMRTFGELVVAMGGDIEIKIHAIEDPLPERTNYDAYAAHDLLSYDKTASVMDAPKKPQESKFSPNRLIDLGGHGPSVSRRVPEEENKLSSLVD